MDLHFSPELEAFRNDVRAFLDEALDDKLRHGAAYNGGMFRITRPISAGTAPSPQRAG